MYYHQLNRVFTDWMILLPAFVAGVRPLFNMEATWCGQTSEN
jgi:hypothetical protein